MFKQYLLYSRPPFQLLVFSALFFMGLLLGTYLTEWLNQQLIGLSSSGMAEFKSIPEQYIGAVKWVNAIALIVVILLPAALYAYLSHPQPLQYLKLHRLPGALFILIGVLLFLVSMPAVGRMEAWGARLPMGDEIKKMDEHYSMVSRSILSTKLWSQFWISTITICLLPAIVEEIFFRACVQTTLLRMMKSNPVMAIIITAVVFSALHGQLSGLIPRVYLGLILGLVFYFSGSLWLSILLHFINNFLSVLLMFMYHRGVIAWDVSSIGNIPLWMALLSMGLTAGGLYFLYTRRQTFEVEDWSEISSKPQ